MVQFELRVGDAAVERTERTESVAREEHLRFRAPGHHRLGPVNHRGEVELKGVRTELDGGALLDLERSVGDAIETRKHLQRLGVADNQHLGIEQTQRPNRRRMVGLHVVYDEVVDRSVTEHLVDVFDKTAAERLLDRIDEGHLLVDNEVGVVRDAVRERPEPLEAGRGAVVDAHVMDSGNDFRDFHNVETLFCCKNSIFLQTELKNTNIDDFPRRINQFGAPQAWKSRTQNADKTTSSRLRQKKTTSWGSGLSLSTCGVIFLPLKSLFQRLD